METHAARFAFLSSLHTPVILSLMLAITRSKDCREEAAFGTGRRTTCCCGVIESRVPQVCREIKQQMDGWMDAGTKDGWMDG